jgi:hypothetical protein
VRLAAVLKELQRGELERARKVLLLEEQSVEAPPAAEQQG